jgi:hypothetical protein
MKKLTTDAGVFGPYSTIEVIENCYNTDRGMLPFTVVGQGTISDVEDGDFPPVIVRPPYDETAASVRKQRTDKLAASDWTQLSDAPINSSVWASYRQQLRDITAQAGFPWEINWPVAP